MDEIWDVAILIEVGSLQWSLMSELKRGNVISRIK